MSLAVRANSIESVQPRRPASKRYRLARKVVAPTGRSLLMGFGPMAKIATSFGEVHAHVLRKGDLVRTSSGAFLPIISINRSTFDESLLASDPDLMPILLQRGALDGKFPLSNMIVAPDQPVQVRAGGMSGGSCKARDLLGRPGVVRKMESIITYTSISLGRPAAICCEGMWIEIQA